jgi:hypothetical protein
MLVCVIDKLNCHCDQEYIHNYLFFNHHISSLQEILWLSSKATARTRINEAAEL